MPEPSEVQTATDFVAELCVHQDPDQAIRRAVELLRAVRRKTLVEAAEATCEFCGMHVLLRQVVDGEQSWWVHTVAELSVLCECGGTHDLLAKLDAEKRP